MKKNGSTSGATDIADTYDRYLRIHASNCQQLELNEGRSKGERLRPDCLSNMACFSRLFRAHTRYISIERTLPYRVQIVKVLLVREVRTKLTM